LFTKLLLTFTIILTTCFCHAQSWNQIPVNPQIASNQILGIHFVNDNIGYVVGTNGIINKTINGGTTWASQTSPVATSLYSTYFITSNIGYAVGDNGVILRTGNGGGTWSSVNLNLNLPTSTDLRKVWFYDANIGYIVGGVSALSGAILKTTDGGLTWTNVSPSPNNGNAIYGIFFTCQNEGYACDFNGNILRTSNGGSSWSITPFTTSFNLHDINFTSGSVGYMVGGNISSGTGVIYKTENSGATWGSPFNVPAFITDIEFYGNNIGYAVGGKINTPGVVYKATNVANGFNNWSPEPISPAIVARQYSLSLPSAKVGYTCGLNGTILKISEKLCCDTFQNTFSNASFTFTSTPPNSVYTFVAPTGTIAGDTFTWDFGDQTTGNGMSTTHNYTTSGTYLVTLWIQRNTPGWNYLQSQNLPKY
jgi:photosystem II stability/assembly factor-like uncharacterized protein